MNIMELLMQELVVLVQRLLCHGVALVVELKDKDIVLIVVLFKLFSHALVVMVFVQTGVIALLAPLKVVIRVTLWENLNSSHQVVIV